jgi:alkylation response protein AidB-like acyl-CoA dehydrogenase
MQWKLTEEQQAYQETLRGWLSDVAPAETVRQWLDEGDQAVFEALLVRDGWAGVGIDEEQGGQGGGVVELALTAEELARAAVPSSAWLSTVLAVPALAGRPELVEKALAGAPAGWLLPGEAIPGASVPHLEVDAEGRLSGRVPRVLGGDRAATFLAVVGDGGERSVRMVDAGAPGVSLVHHRLLDRSRSVADVTLEDVASEPLDVDADAAVAAAADLAGVLLAADALGATERMLDLAVEYSLQRRQFGVPIGSFQAVKHAAATILVGVEAGRSAAYFAAASVGARGPECSLHAAAVKAQVTAEGARAADSALTVHGAIGYTWEHDLQRFFKRARLDEHLFGAPAAWNERIASALALV